MRIGIIKYKISQQHNVGEYLEFLRTALTSDKLDLLVGPDYALSHKFKQVSTIVEGVFICNYLSNLSRHFPNATIIAGTLSLQINQREMNHLALVYKNGKGMQFTKQTDHGEQEVAEKSGLIYVRGNNPAVFYIDDKKAWLHICGDRGRTQNVNGADLEIILAQDINAGFHFGINTPRNARHLILADSYHPKAEIMKFTPPSRYEILKPVKDIKTRIFEI